MIDPMRLCALLFVFCRASLCQPGDLTLDVERGKAALTAGPKMLSKGRDMLALAASRCQRESLQTPACADAYDWLGIANYASAQTDAATLREGVEPLFKRALEIRLAAPDSDLDSVALAYELEALALIQLGNRKEAEPLARRAAELRGRQIAAMSFSDPVTSSTAVRMGQGVQTPQIAARVEPMYSEVARLLKRSGTVVLDVLVDSNGTPQKIRLKQSVGFGLDQRAVEAVKTWRLKPGMKEGQPVGVLAQIEINFRLL